MTDSTQNITKSEAFAQIQRGIINSGLPSLLDCGPQDEVFKGLLEIAKGIEKIESQGAIYESDPFLWDWLTIMKERQKVMKTAFEDFFGVEIN